MDAVTGGKDKHFYETTNSHGLVHDPLNSIIAPRPIGWVFTKGQNGVLNLAPHSFFDAFSYRLPIVDCSSIGAKDTRYDCLSRDQVELTKYVIDPLRTFGISIQMWIDVFDVIRNVTNATPHPVLPPLSPGAPPAASSPEVAVLAADPASPDRPHFVEQLRRACADRGGQNVNRPISNRSDCGSRLSFVSRSDAWRRATDRKDICGRHGSGRHVVPL
jgi:hypothetical protein